MIHFPRMMTQFPEEVNSRGALLEQSLTEVRARTSRLEEDAFKLVRPEQAYTHFSAASKLIDTVSIPCLERLGLVPKDFEENLPKVASVTHFRAWSSTNLTDLCRMAVYSGLTSRQSSMQIAFPKKEEVVEVDEDGLPIEEVEEVEEEESLSDIWSPYVCKVAAGKVTMMKVMISPLSIFPAEYLFEQYFPLALQLHSGMPEGVDVAHWLRTRLEPSYVRLILLDAYNELLISEDYDKALEVAKQRLMLASSVVRNVTAVKSSIFDKGGAVYSPMRMLLDLDLMPGDRTFMSLALGGGKSTALHVSQIESVMGCIVNVCDNLMHFHLQNYASSYWEEDAVDILRYFDLIDVLIDCDDDRVIECLVKCKKFEDDYNDYDFGDVETIKAAQLYRPTSPKKKALVRVYWWLHKIQKFATRVRTAQRKCSWTGPLMQMTLSKESKRLTDSNVDGCRLLDVVSFIEEWRSYDPKRELNVLQPMQLTAIYETLPEYFRHSQYHRLQVIYASNNEELDAFVKSYEMFDIDSSTVQALNSHNVSGLSRDETILMQIPSPVVTAQRRAYNNTSFFGVDLQIRVAIFDERSSAIPSFTPYSCFVYTHEVCSEVFGEDFFEEALADNFRIDGLTFRRRIYRRLYENLQGILKKMCKHGVSSFLEKELEAMLTLASIAMGSRQENELKVLYDHFDMEILTHKDPAMIAGEHPGLQKLCLAASELVVEVAFDIINKTEERQSENE